LSVDGFGEVAYVFCLFHFEGEVKGQSHIADGRDPLSCAARAGRGR
jgi:hypothetical protein